MVVAVHEQSKNLDRFVEVKASVSGSMPAEAEVSESRMGSGVDGLGSGRSTEVGTVGAVMRVEEQEGDVRMPGH